MTYEAFVKYIPYIAAVLALFIASQYAAYICNRKENTIIKIRLRDRFRTDPPSDKDLDWKVSHITNDIRSITILLNIIVSLLAAILTFIVIR